MWAARAYVGPWSEALSSDSLQSNRQPEGTSIQRAALQEPWQEAEWQRLWLAIEGKRWKTLALIPAGKGASLRFTPLVAMILSRTGMVHLGSPVQVADATSVPLNQLTAFFGEVERSTQNGERLLIALPPADDHAVTVSIAQGADAALLCILNERMSSSAAKRTVKLIGPSRFLGSAIFHPNLIESIK